MPDEEFIRIVKESKTFNEILSAFNLVSKGGNNETLKKRCREQNVDFSHIRMGRSHNKGRPFPFRGLSKEEVLKALFIENSNYSRNSLRHYIRKYGFIEYKCQCGNSGLWNDKPLALQIDHINGEHNDNRIENLRWICPNCHSQTETFCGKHKKLKVKPPKISVLDPEWRYRPRPEKRKVVRPSKEELEILIKNNTFVSLGKKFGVSDVAVKKWCKAYKILV